MTGAFFCFACAVPASAPAAPHGVLVVVVVVVGKAYIVASSWSVAWRGLRWAGVEAGVGVEVEERIGDRGSGLWGHRVVFVLVFAAGQVLWDQGGRANNM